MKKQQLNISDGNLECLQQTFPSLTRESLQKGYETEQDLDQMRKRGILGDPAYSEGFAAFLHYRELLRNKHLERLSKEENKAAWRRTDEYFENIPIQQLEAEDLNS